jgi:hypothetical protein
MSGPAHALSYDAAPAFSTPLRFFLTAPLFGVAAGLLLLAAPELLASRWTPGALALTHLMAVGFMLSVMVGALFQILPVVAGAGVPMARPLATLAHAGLTAGAASLSLGLGAGAPDFLVAAVALLGTSFALFLGAVAWGLRRAPIAQATPRDLRLAAVGLGIALMLGMALAMVLARGLPLPLVTLLELHVGWAWLGGAGLLLAATSWVVVPMFQITPSYPAPLTRYWALATCGALVVWSGAVLAGQAGAAMLLAAVLIALAALFAVTTLRLQQRSRRSTPDGTTRAFQLGMTSLLAGLACLLAGHWSAHDAWPILAGILILHGGFASVIEGMLYKIVPFLAWLHLTQDGVRAPNVKKLLPDTPVRRQLVAHGAALAALLAAAASGSAGLGRVAGILVVLEFAWLLANLMRVVRAYRRALAA